MFIFISVVIFLFVVDLLVLRVLCELGEVVVLSLMVFLICFFVEIFVYWDL